MVRYRETAKGRVRLTSEEEAEFLAEVTSRNGAEAKKARLKESLAQLRYEKETAGIVVNGLLVDTSYEGQMRLYTKPNYFIPNRTNRSVRWKGKDGVFKNLSVSELNTVIDAVASYVEACYATEAAHLSAIDALQDDQVDAYDITQNWPDQ